MWPVGEILCCEEPSGGRSCMFGGSEVRHRLDGRPTNRHGRKHVRGLPGNWSLGTQVVGAGAHKEEAGQRPWKTNGPRVFRGNQVGVLIQVCDTSETPVSGHSPGVGSTRCRQARERQGAQRTAEEGETPASRGQCLRCVGGGAVPLLFRSSSSSLLRWSFVVVGVGRTTRGRLPCPSAAPH